MPRTTNAKHPKDPQETFEAEDHEALDQDEEAELERTPSRLATDETEEEELAEDDMDELDDPMVDEDDARYDEAPDA